MPRTRTAEDALALPTPALITELQAHVGYPAVSLLLSTTPAPRMTPEDAARLDALVRVARRRLELEDLATDQHALLDRLHTLAIELAEAPAGAAVALYAADGVAHAVHLTVPVVDRVVIDPTFATRDLVRMLHRTPRHVVLALSSQEARLFEGVGDQLRPATVRSFPRRLDPGAGGGRASGRASGRPGRRDAPTPRGAEDEERKAFLRQVDQALGAYLLLQPAPLVLVGADRVLAEFRRISRHQARLAGSVTGNLINAPTADLIARIREILDAYLLSRQSEALERIEERAATGQAVSGIEAAWLAARYNRPEMLAVEESFFFPARLDETGDTLIAATDVEHPEVIDDAVDELIEAVLRRGGWVAMTADGVLAEHGRVVLTLRR